MLKLLVLSLAALQLAAGQFGGGQTCDYNRLQQASQRKEQCMQEFYDLKMQAMSEIQRSDRVCFQGISDAIQQCRQPIQTFQQQNDLDQQGMMECCFPGRVGSFGNSRRCEFRNKENPMMGKMGKKGKGHHGDHRKKRGHGGMGGGMRDEEMMRKWMSSVTLGDLCMWGAKEHVEMIEHLMWCKGEERMINDQAMDTFRRYKDQLIAKLFQCENMIMAEATNCTDVSYQDIECLMKGYGWIKEFMKSCFMACMPDSLETFCRMMTSGGQGASQNFVQPNNNYNSGYNYRTNNNG